MKEKDIKHLEFIFDRMVYVHNENKNFDYMTRFRDIIEQLRKDNSRKQSKQCNHDFEPYFNWCSEVAGYRCEKCGEEKE